MITARKSTQEIWSQSTTIPCDWRYFSLCWRLQPLGLFFGISVYSKVIALRVLEELKEPRRSFGQNFTGLFAAILLNSLLCTRKAISSHSHKSIIPERKIRKRPHLHGRRYVVHVEIELGSAHASCGQVIGGTESTTDGKGPARYLEREKLVLRNPPSGRSEGPVEDVTVEGGTWKQYSGQRFDSLVHSVGLLLTSSDVLGGNFEPYGSAGGRSRHVEIWKLVSRRGYAKCSLSLITVQKHTDPGKKTRKREKNHDLSCF